MNITTNEKWELCLHIEAYATLLENIKLVYRKDPCKKTIDTLCKLLPGYAKDILASEFDAMISSRIDYLRDLNSTIARRE